MSVLTLVCVNVAPDAEESDLVLIFDSIWREDIILGLEDFTT